MTLLGLLGASRTAPVLGRPSPWTRPANVVVDGNSIYSSLYSDIGPFSEHIFAVEPFASSGFEHSDAGIPNQTWQDMTDNFADVAALYRPGRANVLVAAETTNAVYGHGMSATATVADVTEYITRARYWHPNWFILLLGSLPAQGYTTPEADLERNLIMIDVDERLAANHKALGADAYVGFRDLPPFVGNGITTPYDDFADCWHDHVHPSDIGKVYMRQRVAEALLALGDWTD